jgi:hypothetical protein
MQCSTLVAAQGGWLCRSTATWCARAATRLRCLKGSNRVVHGEHFVRDLYGECGLELREPVRHGCWCGRPDGMSGQDVAIAVKGREQASSSKPKESI